MDSNSAQQSNVKNNSGKYHQDAGNIPLLELAESSPNNSNQYNNSQNNNSSHYNQSNQYNQPQQSKRNKEAQHYSQKNSKR